MRKRLISLILSLMMVVGLVPALAVPAAAATAPTKMWVAPTDTNGIPAQIDVFVSATSTTGYGTNKITTYTCGLYLPGNVDTSNCFLSWDNSMQVTVDGTTYESGTCPVPSPGSTITYDFTGGSPKNKFVVTTWQGSASVVPVFIEIDETYTDNDGVVHTIAAMDGDADHEKYCVGQIYINGQQYEMPKIKGRGNYTWKMSKDKRAYNITLGSKIKFPGINSAKTKKWSILSEVGDHSLLCNRTGFKLAHEMGIGQDTASADVWMNGEYQGCYTVTPKTDSFVTDDGFMIENDNYEEHFSVEEGGDPQFHLTGLLGSNNNQKNDNLITVKKIGDNLLLKDGKVDESAENLIAVSEKIQEWLQDAWDAIRSDTGYNSKGKYYTDYIDIESFAKMYLMHEYVKSYDICAGSILFHRDGQTDADKLIAGPIWDLDNSLGSTQQNSSLGMADNRRNGDRRSGEGDFISNVTEYKTSIYKTIYSKHADFRAEVKLQYNKYRESFEALLGDVETMEGEINASAQMNHRKVNDISNYNLHKYDSDTPLGSDDYVQNMLATTNSKTDWPNYVSNLKTYVTARSLWFHNTYWDVNYCEHEYEPVITAPTCTAEGRITYTCSKCGDSYEEILPKIAHNYQDGVCTVCGEELLTAEIVYGEGASVTVYETKKFDGDPELNAVSAHPRNGDTGLIDCSGNGQINFVVNLDQCHTLVGVTAEPEGTDYYANLKGPKDTGIENGYRLTKVKSNLTITVETAAAHDLIDHPAQEPTQTEVGWHAYQTCSRCDYTTYEEIPALGPLPEFKTHSLELKGDIGVWFYMDLPEIEGVDYTDSYMEFTVSGKTTKADFNPGFRDDNKQYYGFTCYVSSIQMAETITAVFHYGEGLTVDSTYSVVDYLLAFEEIQEQQELFDEKTVTMVKALADYGHYVQPFLADYNDWIIGEDYAEMYKFYAKEYDFEEVAAALEDYKIVRNLGDSGLKRISHSLRLDASTSLYVYFEPETGYNGSFSVKVNGKTKKATLLEDGRYRVTISNISAQYLGKPYTVIAETDKGTATVNVSALSYAQAMLGAYENKPDYLNAAAALWYYYAAAIAYNSDNS